MAGNIFARSGVTADTRNNFIADTQNDITADTQSDTTKVKATLEDDPSYFDIEDLKKPL